MEATNTIDDIKPFYSQTGIIKDMISETQGDMYALAKKQGYDMEAFSKAYLKSDFCRYEMDSEYSK